MARHPEITRRPLTVADLQRTFDERTPGSSRSLLIRMGPFTAGVDAFRFTNSFPLTGEIVGKMAVFASEQVVREVARALSAGYLDKLTSLRIPIPLLPDLSLPGVAVDFVMNRVVTELTGRLLGLGLDPAGRSYGRCGGMAFAGYDLYLRGRPVDTRTTIPPEDSPLDRYLHDRLLDSLDLNIRTFLEWLLILHVMPRVDEIATAALLGAVGGPLGAALGAFIGSKVDIFELGGADKLLDKSRSEWTTIKRRLDEQAAWPIGLIFGDKKNPFDQHQVLAVRYSEPAAGRARLVIWDNNRGNRETTLDLDFRDDSLKVGGIDGNVKGIFAERYQAKNPPAGV